MDTHHNIDKTLILLFANSPELEARRKCFRPDSKRKNEEIARLLYRRSLCEAKKTGLPVLVVQQSQQIGSSFQERLANAVEHAWALGYSRQLVIGSDAPEADHHLLLEAARQLESKDWVLGPSKDGGAYIIGFRRKAYQRESFLNLPWQSPQLFDSYKRQLQTLSNNGHCLPEFTDVDSYLDLKELLEHKRLDSALKNKLRSLLQHSRLIIPTALNLRKLHSIPYQALRAPPAA
ncbi:MAG: DUF2064 domain-containing protein [Bacteroidetes bacterium]|nr:DUF2064 domain-containing protein [Bacteroidota bacterium]